VGFNWKPGSSGWIENSALPIPAIDVPRLAVGGLSWPGGGLGAGAGRSFGFSDAGACLTSNCGSVGKTLFAEIRAHRFEKKNGPQGQWQNRAHTSAEEGGPPALLPVSRLAFATAPALQGAT